MIKVLNFGSLNLDYVYQVDHFVRAGETISSKGRECFLGGKGLNQSIALSRAGAQVYHAGAVGKDGDALLQVLKKNGVDVTFVNMVDGPSGHAIIQRVADGQNCIFLFSGANRAITKEQVEQVISEFAEDDYLILQNEINNIDLIIQRAKEKGMKIVLNPSPMNEKIIKAPLHLVDVLILNEVEAGEFCEGISPEAILEGLRSKFPQAAIVLTVGEKGVWYQDNTMSSIMHNSSYKVDVEDTTAAGDTFTGYFISCISKGKTIKESLEIASKAAALAVSKRGAEASIPTMEDVVKAQFIPA